MNPGNPARFCVGITGGIGSGKSAVTDQLQTLGVVVVDADVVAREVVEPGSSALEQIVERYGKDLVDETGQLQRRRLREIVFAQPDERRWLEELTHPLIRERIAEQLLAAQSAYVVLSSPLLLEGRQKDFVDHVVVVDVAEDTQLARTMARDNNSEKLVRSIMRAQASRQERLSQADSVLDNDGSRAELTLQVDKLHQTLLRLAECQ